MDETGNSRAEEKHDGHCYYYSSNHDLHMLCGTTGGDDGSKENTASISMICAIALPKESPFLFLSSKLGSSPSSFSCISFTDL